MSFNSVASVMKHLGPDTVGRIAEALSLDRAQTQKATDAMVPAILAGMAGTATKAEGARKLFDVLRQQDPGLLDKLGGLLGGPQHDAVIQHGTAFLGQVLGGPPTKALTGAVAKHAGLGEAQASTLMGVLAPVVMGSLAQYQEDNDLDAGGLASLLGGQKEVLAQAMPSGFLDALGGTSWFDVTAGGAGLERAATGEATPVPGAASLVPKSVQAAVGAGTPPHVAATAGATASLAGPAVVAATTTAAASATAKGADPQLRPTSGPAASLGAAAAHGAAAGRSVEAPRGPAATAAPVPAAAAKPTIKPEVKTAAVPKVLTQQGGIGTPRAKPARDGISLHWLWVVPVGLALLGGGGGWWWMKTLNDRPQAMVAEKASPAVAQTAPADAARAKADADTARVKADADAASAAAANARRQAAAKAKADADAAAAPKPAAEAQPKVETATAPAAPAPVAPVPAASVPAAPTPAATAPAAPAPAAPPAPAAAPARPASEPDADAARKAADTAIAMAEARHKAQAEAAAARLAADNEARRKAEAEAAAASQAAAAKARAEAAAAIARTAADAEARRRADAAAATAARPAAVDNRAGMDLLTCQNAVNTAAASGRIQFGTASATLTKDSIPTLNQLVAAIKACPAIRIRVEGHTDSDGDYHRNLKLSNNRARSVAAYLAKAGIPSNRLRSEGLGQSKPLVVNDSNDNKRRNRRIELLVDRL